MNENKKETKKEIKLLAPTKHWLILVTIRIILNVFSQRSYIHPDEFFQGLEVIAGDLFKCGDKIHRTWEFEFGRDPLTNETVQEPIRNMAIPYFFYGLPLTFLKYFSELGSVSDYTLINQQQQQQQQHNQHHHNHNQPQRDFNLISVQTNTLIYYPRLFMTFFSLLVDICLFNLASLCDLEKSSVLTLFSSSYISIVYLTRTFSNSIETVLFSLLVYLVIKSIKSQYVLNDKFIIESNANDKTQVKSVLSSFSNEFQINKKGDLNSIDDPNITNNNSSLSTNNSLKRLRLFDIFQFSYLGEAIGLVLAVGLFNRPTFLVFAFTPIAFWLLYGLDNCNTNAQVLSYLLRRLLSLSKLFVPASALLVLFDTIYFYKIASLHELYWHLSERKLILTPLNFFVYNTNGENLKQHGQHPFYQHYLNCFLLFGLNQLILTLIFVQYSAQLLKQLRLKLKSEDKSKTTKWSRLKLRLKSLYKYLINNLLSFLLLSFLVPFLAFSLVSHKEPRFLLPLIVPISLLTSNLVFGKQSYAVLKLAWLGFNFIMT